MTFKELVDFLKKKRKTNQKEKKGKKWQIARLVI